MSETVEVFENLSDNVITFDSKEEFMRYYNKNKESIDKMATRGLNTKYKINGFKIGRKQGSIILYPLKTEIKNIVLDSKKEYESLSASSGVKQEPKQNQDQYMIKINSKLNDLNKRLKVLEENMNYILNMIEQN